MKGIDPARRQELNQGSVETANLVEALAVDVPALIHTVYPRLVFDPHVASLGIVKRMSSYAGLVYKQHGITAFEKFKTHTSDMLRGMACYMPPLAEVSLEKQLQLIRPLADDKHFGVREWAWMAIRPALIVDLSSGLLLLQPWAEHSSERLRRYALEITRPRGVWCSHIQALRNEPWLAEALLCAVRKDPSRYVQLSVGNWLNDASKHHSRWVVSLCERWIDETKNNDSTKKIVARALRTVRRRSE